MRTGRSSFLLPCFSLLFFHPPLSYSSVLLRCRGRLKRVRHAVACHRPGVALCRFGIRLRSMLGPRYGIFLLFQLRMVLYVAPGGFRAGFFPSILESRYGCWCVT